MMTKTVLDTLARIRSQAAAPRTLGLPDGVIEQFCERDYDLVQAIDEAAERHAEFRREFPDLAALDEAGQVAAMQSRYLNFYAADAVNPYVALAARGPWIVTSKGAVVHDSGGYGMLGFGHGPQNILDAMSRPQAMANVMTANPSQIRLARALETEIGHTRADGCPFDRFVCLNSGSESMTLASRLADINAKRQTDPGAPHEGQPIKKVSLEGGFHGRTDRPARLSDSTRCHYENNLASFRDRDDLITVPANDVDHLTGVFSLADEEGWFIEGVYFEPVMGEGNPGMAITRKFYDAARALTNAHGSMLVVDSIQAGLRAQGCLSIVDYPGFQDAEAPEVEAYSKALNAGQYPLSVLALTDRAAELYPTGVYGNTMTTNPRALDVAVAVLDRVNPSLRHNIRERGAELLRKLQTLADELSGSIVAVQGTGLLVSCALAPELRSHGHDSIEESMRIHGIGVIHGGSNSIRYTPHFEVTSSEIDLIVDATRAAVVRASS